MQNAEKRAEKPDTYPSEADIDEAIKESFPASDPPAWTLGIENPPPTKEPDDEKP